MIKKQIHFSERQYELFTTEAKKLGIPLAELLRRVFDAYLDEKKSNEQK